MSKKKSLLNAKTRRDFLKGAGTIAIGLPLFDFMLNSSGTAYANGLSLPQRFVTMYNGLGLGWKESNTSVYVPNKIGSNYDLKIGINSIGQFDGIKDYTSVVTNQRIPYKKWSENGVFGDPGPGGLSGMFHRCSGLVQLSGTRVIEIAKKKYKTKSSPTADTLFADFLGQKPFYFTVSPTSYEWHRYIPNLDLSKLTSRFNGFDMQTTKNGDHLSPEQDPQRAFNKLVGISNEVNNPKNNQALVAIQTKQKSILDFIDRRRVQYLKNELSKRDIANLNDHFDYIREIEKSIKVDTSTPEASTCEVKAQNFTYGKINTANRFSDEDKRATAWADVLNLAFKCDALRTGMLQITEGQSTMRLKNISGQDYTYHESGHGPNNSKIGIDNYSKGYNWHVSVVARLASKLKNSKEGDGNILDNSAIVLCSEGGMGLSSDDGQNNSTHSVDNMVSVICGKAGNLKGGVHIKTNKSHPSKVLISAMNACSDGKINSLGEVSGKLDELFK